MGLSLPKARAAQEAAPTAGTMFEKAIPGGTAQL